MSDNRDWTRRRLFLGFIATKMNVVIKSDEMSAKRRQSVGESRRKDVLSV